MTRRAEFWTCVSEGGARFVRSARASPLFTAGVVGTLALGIGANATMYGIVDRLLLRPPEHVERADEIRRVFVERASSVSGEPVTSATLAYLDFTDLRQHPGLSGVAAYTSHREVTIGSGPDATRARAVLASAEFFVLLGVEPIVGRFFNADEARGQAPGTVVLSHEYWRRAFGATVDVLGADLEIAGRVHTIVGVTPPGFTGLDLTAVDVWLPLEATHRADRGERHCLERRGCMWMHAAVRLRDGVGVPAAEAEATGLHLNGRRDDIEAGFYSDRARVLLASVIVEQGPSASGEGMVARWLAGVSVIVLLIASTNVANLLLVRGTTRRHEVAVRTALGVSRRQLVGQMMVEAALLALAGGIVALGLARWGGEILRTQLLPGVSFPGSGISARVFAVTLLVSVASGMFAGLAPAIRASRAPSTSELIHGSRRILGTRARLGGTLTLLQAALSVMLLVGAGLFLRSLSELRGIDLGLDADRLLVAEIEPRNGGLSDADLTTLYHEAASRIETLPEVAAATVTSVPFQYMFVYPVGVPGVDSIPTLPGGGPYYFPVTSSYFETTGVRITSGRGFDESDAVGSADVAIVSATMAEVLWPDDDPLGACLLVGGRDDCTTVVGIAEDAAVDGYQSEPYMAYYLPLAQFDEPARALFVRARGEPQAAAGAVASALRSLSPEVRYANVRTLQEILDPQARSWTLGARMFSLFGFLALVLSGVGLYGVLAFDVARRTREIGIRAALGSTRGAIVRAVVRYGAVLTGGGLCLGLLISYAVAPYLSDLLFEVSPRDPVVLGGVVLVLLCVGLMACLVPALRAASVDPAEAMRGH